MATDMPFEKSMLELVCVYGQIGSFGESGGLTARK